MTSLNFVLGDITKLDVDAVVIGTGAGGSIALRELARAGVKAIALEEGAWSRSADIEQQLVVGVHGPGEVHVVLTPPGSSPSKGQSLGRAG